MMNEMRAILVGADLVSELVSRMSREVPMLISQTVVSGVYHAESVREDISGGRMLALAPFV